MWPEEQSGTRSLPVTVARRSRVQVPVQVSPSEFSNWPKWLQRNCLEPNSSHPCYLTHGVFVSQLQLIVNSCHSCQVPCTITEHLTFSSSTDGAGTAIPPCFPAGKQVWRSAPVHPAVGGGALPLTYTVLRAREASLDLGFWGGGPTSLSLCLHSSCCSVLIKTLFLCMVHFGFAPGAQFSTHHCPACTAHGLCRCLWRSQCLCLEVRIRMGSLSKVCHRACPGIQTRSGSYSCLNWPKHSLC